ncbi:MAG: SRPBCC family protein [Candidatus Dormibacteraeota bacterium]|nr:SRPBCC family protein [Candidatus Dormibacteraeota bacterium]
MPAEYHFKTEWEFNADLPRAWSVVLDLQQYPARWRNFRRVRLLQGDGQSVGSRFECVVRGSLPYSLRYTMEVMAVDRHRSINLRSSGDLVGTGRWEFAEAASRVCRATYFWDVATTSPILNLVALFARPLLTKNHDQVMANGYRALRALIET